MSGPPYLPGRREIGNYRVHRGERGGRWPVRTIGVDPARPGPPRIRAPETVHEQWRVYPARVRMCRYVWMMGAGR